MGLLDLNDPRVVQVFSEAKINVGRIRIELDKLVKNGLDIVTLGSLPFTPRTKKAYELAKEHARELGREGNEEPVDVLYGLINEVEGIAAQVLLNLGFRYPSDRLFADDVLIQAGFKIHQARAYRGDNPMNYVVTGVADERPNIVYHCAMPDLVGDALDARKIFDDRGILYNEEPSLSEVTGRLCRGIQTRAGLVERIAGVMSEDVKKKK